MAALWLACDATFTLATVAAAGGLTWSAPVLLEAPTASWPLGPDSPAYAYGFDHKHMFGPKSGIKEGRGSTWQFSSDGGLSFVTQTTHLSGAVNTLIPIDDPSIPGRRSFRDLGHYDLGSAKAATPFQYNLTRPAVFSLLPNGSGISVDAAPGGVGPAHQVTFSGIPQPGFNFTASGTPGQYGITRAGNGQYVMQANVLWNNVPVYHSYGRSWGPMSVVSFTSADGYAWDYGGVVANGTRDVQGNPFGPAGVEHPVMIGPTESDIALLADGKTLLSVVRMDGDSGCFGAEVPPAHRNANYTVYRNYAASFSTNDGRSWTRPRPIEGTGCARPRLMRLSGGPLLLSGGRLCVENMTGIFLWVNEDGMGGFDEPASNGTKTFVRHSITAQHNRLWKGDPKYLFRYAKTFGPFL
jgi:hypothetical protein